MTDIIKKKRKLMGMTQKELADRLGVRYQTISNIENGKAYSKELLEKVCDILDLEVRIVDIKPIERKKEERKSNRVLSID